MPAARPAQPVSASVRQSLASAPPSPRPAPHSPQPPSRPRRASLSLPWPRDPQHPSRRPASARTSTPAPSDAQKTPRRAIRPTREGGYPPPPPSHRPISACPETPRRSLPSYAAARRCPVFRSHRAPNRPEECPAAREEFFRKNSYTREPTTFRFRTPGRPSIRPCVAQQCQPRQPAVRLLFG